MRRRIVRGEDSHGLVTASLISGPVGGGGSTRTMPEMIEDARKAGWDEGYQAAVAEFATAEASGRSAQMRRVADAVIQACTEVAKRREEVVSTASAEAASLAFDLAEAILQRELSVSRASVEAISRAFKLVPAGQDLIVRVNPAELIDPTELQDMIQDAAVKVVADPAVEIGGAVVQAGPCRIDAQVGSALQRARDVIAEMYPDQIEQGAGR